MLTDRHANLEAQPAASKQDADRLHELGYDQDLKRGWSTLESFGSSFSVISVCTGITTSFLLGLTNGGPGTMAVGWICVSFMTMFVAASMAEVVSAVPSAGGPMHWAALLARPRYSAFAAYSTGWFNFLGQAAVTTGIVFGNANLIATLASLHGFESSPARIVGIHAGLLFFAGTVNSVSVGVLAHLNRLSILLHSVGVFSLGVAVLAKAPTHMSAKEVFGTFYDGSGDPGWSVRASPAYVAVTGILLAQYTITGFDASAHMAEETADAGRAAPRGVLISVGASALFGLFYLLSLLFSMQSFERAVNSDQPVLEIFIDVFGKTGATVAMAFIICCVTLCGTFSVTSNSRMFYAFSRDSGIPRWFDYVDKRTQAPFRTVWLAVVLAFILALPSLGSSVAFTAVTSIATIGLYISYAIPIAIAGVDQKRFREVRGPFHLGALSRPVALIATAYVVFITVVFCLPTANPVDIDTLNYAPVAVGIVIVWIVASWLCGMRKVFHGPHQGSLAELGDKDKVARVVSEEKKLQSVGEADGSIAQVLSR
ncbi:hypothetical protein JCM3770_004824 [Rhodotorula araucariae]